MLYLNSMQECACGKTSTYQRVMLLIVSVCFFSVCSSPVLCVLRHFSRLFAKTQRPWSLKRTPLLIWQTTEWFSALLCSFFNKITHSLQFILKKKKKQHFTDCSGCAPCWPLLILEKKTSFNQNCLVAFCCFSVQLCKSHFEIWRFNLTTFASEKLKKATWKAMWLHDLLQIE